MAKNVEINVNTNDSNYEVLYPKANYSNMANVLSITNTSDNLSWERITGGFRTQYKDYVGTSSSNFTINFDYGYNIQGFCVFNLDMLSVTGNKDGLTYDIPRGNLCIMFDILNSEYICFPVAISQGSKNNTKLMACETRYKIYSSRITFSNGGTLYVGYKTSDINAINSGYAITNYLLNLNEIRYRIYAFGYYDT